VATSPSTMSPGSTIRSGGPPGCAPRWSAHSGHR
jgi:hypothetical protein